MFESSSAKWLVLRIVMTKGLYGWEEFWNVHLLMTRVWLSWGEWPCVVDWTLKSNDLFPAYFLNHGQWMVSLILSCLWRETGMNQDPRRWETSHRWGDCFQWLQNKNWTSWCQVIITSGKYDVSANKWHIGFEINPLFVCLFFLLF